MRLLKKRSIAFIAICAFLFTISAFAPANAQYVSLGSLNEPRPIKQGNLAAILVTGMGLEARLPVAPSSADYTRLLDKEGVRPLGGWAPNKELTTGDLAVILVYAIGADRKLASPEEIVTENLNYIQNMWDIQYGRDGRWESLEKLLLDRRFFPDGPPADPYGYQYTDADGDYIIDAVPMTSVKIKDELYPAVKYIYTLKSMGVPLDADPGRIVTDKTVKQILQGPIFRSALPHEVIDVPLTKKEEAQAEQSITPITPGG